MSKKPVKTQDNSTGDQAITPDSNVVGIFERLVNRNNPYLTDAADAARDDLRHRLPAKYAGQALQALSDASDAFPTTMF